MTPAGHRFLPWVRSGIAASVPVGPGGGGVRAAVDVAVRVEKTHGSQDVGVRLHLYGPGDVVGIDTRQVIRSDPPHDTAEFEANYLVAVEFDDIGLPWMLSPDTSPDPASADGRLRPWICLVVVRGDRAEIDASSRPLPRLRVSSAATELPDLTESWAWAHAEVTGDGGAVAEAPPERTLSRLLSPRRLEPRTRYVACVVPAFLAGVRAGLGGEPVQTDAPAWPWPPPAVVDLPLYHWWEFTTSESGDFEELVRRLAARDLPEGVGVQPLDMSDPGAGLPATQTLGLEGALRSAAMHPVTWPDESKDEFQSALRALLEEPSGSVETLVVPPIYGAYETAITALPPHGAGPAWLEELNLDPRYRAAAGLGARVVERDQEQLVASAWEQLGELERANQVLRQAQLARTVGASLREHRLEPLSPEAALRLTEPGHARVTSAAVGPGTVREQVQQSRFPESAIAPEFRRALRPLGPVARRMPTPGGSDPVLVDALATGAIEVPIRDPDGVVTRPQVNLSRADLNKEVAAGWRSIGAFRGSAQVITRAAAQRPLLSAMQRRPESEWDDRWHSELPDDVEEEDRARRSRLAYIIHNFRDASQAHQDFLARPAPTVPAAVPPDLPVGDVHGQLLGAGGALDPERTVAGDAGARVERPPACGVPADDPLTPIAARPSFPQPMYAGLQRELAEALLPGAAGVPAETVGVLLGNAAFIEAYMAGLNRGLQEELFWRGYPIDRTATAFRWFWDPRGAAAGSGSEPVPDVPPIAEWAANAPLGSHARGVGGEGMVVLMIRGEVVRRYPSLTVYAVPAAAAPALDGPTLHPQFRGRLEPDILFAGFALSIDEARGSGTETDGWYFVMQEPPTGSRFGLDAIPFTGPPRGWAGRPATWDELSWSDLVPSAAALRELTNVAVAAPGNPALSTVESDGARWGRSAADMARATFQRPVRVAVHARRLLAYASGTSARVEFVDHGDDRIEAIGGVLPNGTVWRIDEEAAIALVQRGERSFYVERPTGDRAEVVTGQRHGRPYLRTVADGDRPNNLLALPPFPA
jgi:hypothetical protein